MTFSVTHHTIKGDISGSGSSPMTTPSVDTSTATGSVTIIVVAYVQNTGTFAATPLTDNKGNTYTAFGTAQTYAGGGGGAWAFKCEGATVGSGHTWSLNKASGFETNEATIMVSVISDAGAVNSWSYAATDDYDGSITPGASGRVLISGWGPADFSGSSQTYAISGSTPNWTLLDYDGRANLAVNTAAHAWRTSADTSAHAITYTATPGSVSTGSGMYMFEVLQGTPVFTAQPENQSAASGGTATFNCTTTGATSYQWQSASITSLYSECPGTWSDIGSATTEDYTTPTLGSSDNGKWYRLKATNSNGDSYSTAVRVWIRGLESTGKGRLLGSAWAFNRNRSSSQGFKWLRTQLATENSSGSVGASVFRNWWFESSAAPPVQTTAAGDASTQASAASMKTGLAAAVAETCAAFVSAVAKIGAAAAIGASAGAMACDAGPLAIVVESTAAGEASSVHAAAAGKLGSFTASSESSSGHQVVAFKLGAGSAAGEASAVAAAPAMKIGTAGAASEASTQGTAATAKIGTSSSTAETAAQGTNSAASMAGSSSQGETSGSGLSVAGKIGVAGAGGDASGGDVSAATRTATSQPVQEASGGHAVASAKGVVSVAVSDSTGAWQVVAAPFGTDIIAGNTVAVAEGRRRVMAAAAREADAAAATTTAAAQPRTRAAAASRRINRTRAKT